MADDEMTPEEQQQIIEDGLLDIAEQDASAFAEKAEELGLTWDSSADCYIGPGGKQYDRYGKLI